MKNYYFLSLLLLLSMFFVSCGSSSTKQPEYVPEGYPSVYKYIDFCADSQEGKKLCFKILSPTTCAVRSSAELYDDLRKMRGNNDYVFGTITIPSHVIWQGELLTVTSIWKSAFVHCSNAAVINLPSTLESIYSFAFCNCENLESLNLPSNLKVIDDYAFTGCRYLKSFGGFFPDSLETLGSGVFTNCISLEDKIIIPDGWKWIPDHLFDNCVSLKGIVIPASMKSIGYDVFYGCI